MLLNVTIVFDRSLQDATQDVLRRVQQAARVGIIESRTSIRGIIRDRCIDLVPVRTGRLRNSLRSDITPRGISIDGVFYWPFVDRRRGVVQNAIRIEQGRIAESIARHIERAVQRELAS